MFDVLITFNREYTNSNRSKHNGTVWEISLLGWTIHKVRDGKIPVWHALHLCEDDCDSFSNTAGSSDRTNLSYFKPPQQPPWKPLSKRRPTVHCWVLGVPVAWSMFHNHSTTFSIEHVPSKNHPNCTLTLFQFSLFQFIFFFFLFLFQPPSHTANTSTQRPRTLWLVPTVFRRERFGRAIRA